MAQTAGLARALAHKDLAWIVGEIPPKLRNNPRVVKSFLATAAGIDPQLADSQAFRAAIAASSEQQQTDDLQARVAQIYHDPTIRELAAKSGLDMDYYWSHPKAAYDKLIKLSASNPKLFNSPALQAAVHVLAEAREFNSSQGITEAAPAAEPIPSGAAARDAEYDKLIKANATGRLSQADSARLMQLAAARSPEDADGQPVVDMPAEATQSGLSPEYTRLLAANSSGKLSETDSARLLQLGEARAVAQVLTEEERG